MIVVTPRFPTITPLPSGGFEVGQTFTVRDGDKEFIIVKGEKINFASLPFFARLIWKTWGKYTISTVVHDVLYKTKQFSRSYTDDLFRRMMEEYEVDWWTQRIFYGGVRMNIVAELKW